MDNQLCFKNAYVFIKDKFVKTDLFVENGIIKKNLNINKCKIIDCKNAHILPSCIDLNILPLNKILSSQNIQSLLQKAMKGGVSSIFLNPYTLPNIDNEAMNALIENINNNSFVNIFSLIPAINNNGKINDINILHSLNKHASAIYCNSNINANAMFQCMKYAKMLDIAMCVFAYDDSMNDGMAYESNFARKLGIPMISPLNQIKEVAKIKEMAKFLDIKIIFSPLNLTYCINLIKNEKKMYSQVPLPHLIFDENNIKDYDTTFKIMPPLLTKNEKNKLLDSLKNQHISFLTSLHNCVSNSLKNVDFETASTSINSLQDFFSVAFTKLVDSQIISLEYLLKLTSLNLARLFNLKKGQLMPGYDADFMIADLNKTRILKDNNSPYCDLKVKSEIKSLVVSGKICEIN